MQLTTLFLQALTLSTTATASTLLHPRQESATKCLDAYKACIAAGHLKAVCQCDLATCTGEDSARLRSWCATATLGPQPSQTFTPTTTTTSSSSASIITGTPGSQPSGQAPITAPENSLALGAICSDTRQCMDGADCFGSTAFTIRRCGNFNAQCSQDSQCAFNTCNHGLCNGFLQTSSVVSSTTMATSTTKAAACHARA